MISGIQFNENGVPNITQNRGNYAIVKQVPLQPSPLWGENVGKIYSTWIFAIKYGFHAGGYDRNRLHLSQRLGRSGSL